MRVYRIDLNENDGCKASRFDNRGYQSHSGQGHYYSGISH